VLSLRVISKTRNLEYTHQPLESYTDIIKRHLGMGQKRDLQLTNVNMMVNGYSQNVQEMNEKCDLQSFFNMSKIN